MNRPIALYGSGGHATCILSILKALNMRPAIVFDDSPNGASTFYGIPLLDSAPSDALAKMHDFVIAIGDSKARLDVARRLAAQGATFAKPIIHPRACVEMGSRLARGSVVFPMAVIGPQVVIESNAHILNGVTVSHDAFIRSSVTLCDGAHIGGNAVCHAASYVGLGASVLPRVHVGEGAVIGAGAVVTRNIPDHAVAYGVPARVRSTLTEGVA